MPTWDEFAWAAFLYGAIGGDRDYQGLMSQTQFLNSLMTNPMKLQVNQIQQQLIKGFFNRWKCRVQNTPQSAGSIQTTLQNLLPYLQVLDNFTIKNLHFTQMVNVNNNQMKVRQVIEHSYTKVRSIGYRFAATATSKLLHILQPELFVMWDKDILNHYKQINSQVSDSGQGYYVYLEIMQQVATQVNQSFQNATLNPPAGANQNPAVYLSTQMNYNPPKTLAKYLDEYNWVTITNGVQVPPSWHP
ncbi:hypothetical protein ES703_71120 [subsurface metagenome]